MNRIQEFFNERFGTVRTVALDNQLYFFGIDIARALGYSNASKAITTHCKKTVKRTLETSNSQNGKTVKGSVTLINRSDIYRLIVKSKLESADEFESWIFEDVLPTVEKTGAYIEDARRVVDNYFSSLSEDTKLLVFKELQSKVEESERENKELRKFYDDLMNTKGLMDMNTVAKELKIGEYTLFAYLRGKKVLFYNSDNVNIPYERFRKEDKFAVIETPCRDGKIRSVTYATKKGLDYIRKLLRKDGHFDVEVSAS